MLAYCIDWTFFLPGRYITMINRFNNKQPKTTSVVLPPAVPQQLQYQSALSTAQIES